jgi:regulator of sirC expression with transglutaminase-like and TPR domain
MMNPFSKPEEAQSYLQSVGDLDDQDIDIFEVSMALSSVHRPSVVIDKYRQHFQTLVNDMKAEFEKLCAEKNSNDTSVQALCLKKIMAQKHGYDGDVVDYNNLQNIDIMRVIDRRLGMPITLSIIAIAVSRAVGWQADGINFPGHFLMCLSQDGQKIILDPFNQCKEMNAPDLRTLVKANKGDDAELSADYYLPCSNRDTLLRLQNNLKYRFIESEHYQEAMEIVNLMMMIAPADHRLDLDMAVLLARLEQPKAAVKYLTDYIGKVENPFDRAEAEAFLQELNSILH